MRSEECSDCGLLLPAYFCILCGEVRCEIHQLQHDRRHHKDADLTLLALQAQARNVQESRE